MTDTDEQTVALTNSKAVDIVMSALQDDIVSYADFVQLVRNASCAETDVASCCTDVLRKLLTAGVQIGQTANQNGVHVKFIAWRGLVQERIERAQNVLRIASDLDRGFAVWLCLESRIDSYED